MSNMTARNTGHGRFTYLPRMALEKFTQTRWVRVVTNIIISMIVAVALVERGQAFFSTPPKVAPLANVAKERPTAEVLDTIVRANLFGVAEDAALNGKILGRTALNLIVTGLLAANGSEQGVALISANGQPEAAFTAGEDILPGVQLRSVESDRVVISRNGTLESVPLKELTEAGGVAPLVVASSADVARTPAQSSPWVRRNSPWLASNAASHSGGTASPTSPPSPAQPPTKKDSEVSSEGPTKPAQSSGKVTGPSVPSPGAKNIQVPRPPAGASTLQVPRPAPGAPTLEVPRAPAGAPVDGPPRPTQ